MLLLKARYENLDHRLLIKIALMFLRTFVSKWECCAKVSLFWMWHEELQLIAMFGPGSTLSRVGKVRLIFIEFANEILALQNLLFLVCWNN